MSEQTRAFARGVVASLVTEADLKFRKRGRVRPGHYDALVVVVARSEGDDEVTCMIKSISGDICTECAIAKGAVDALEAKHREIHPEHLDPESGLVLTPGDASGEENGGPVH